MKYLLLLVILFPFYSFSQSIKDLDNQNGYKDLKFTMPLDSILKKANAKKNDNDILAASSYDVQNSKYKKLGKFRAKEVSIFTYDSRYLVEFFFTMDKHDRNEYLELISYFRSLYGEPTIKDEKNNTYKWKGSKVMIALSYSDEVQMVAFNIYNLSVIGKN